MLCCGSVRGLKGWAAAELQFVEDAVEHDASTGAVIGDELEVIAEKANEVATTVAQPQVGHGAAACSDLAVLVVRWFCKVCCGSLKGFKGWAAAGRAWCRCLVLTCGCGSCVCCPMLCCGSLRGFKGWAAAELPFVEDAVEYDASTGADW
jgi:hypothetical protein